MTQWGEQDLYESKYDRAIEDASASGEIFGEGSYAANYGRGVRIDLQAFLKESRMARSVMEKLDPVEKFVLLGYFLLRKTEKQLAELVGLNECRFNQFLKNLVNKVGALVVFGSIDPEAWEEVLTKEGVGLIHVRKIEQGKPTKALKEERLVKTVDVLLIFLKTRSFLKVGEHFGSYYVDLRRGLEEVAEKMKSKKELAVMSLGEFIGSQVQFAAVQQEGYAGRMGKMPALIKVEDPEVLGRDEVRVDKGESSSVLILRALGSIQGSGI